MRHLPLYALAAGTMAALSPMPAHAFDVDFEWGKIPLCTSGHPNVVKSPRFELHYVPKGAVKLSFALKDLDVDYDHGGGIVPYIGQGPVEAGVFEYKSPCPPNGPHTYRWIVTPYDAAGKPIGQALVEKRYP